MELGFADLMFFIAFGLLGFKMYKTIKTLNRRTYQDPKLNPMQKDLEVTASEPEPSTSDKES